MRHGGELSKIRFHVDLEGDEGSLVAHLVAVVWRTEDGNALSVVVNLVPFVLHLVRANKQF